MQLPNRTSLPYFDRLFKLPKKQILNISLVWTSTILNVVLAFITQVILARSLDVSSYGLLSATLGLIALLMPFAGFGISSFWLKYFGKEGSQSNRWLRPSIKFTILTVVFLFIVVHLWALLGPNEEMSRTLILILVWTILGTVAINIVSAKYQLEDNFLMYSLVQILPVTLKLIAVFIIINLAVEGYLLLEISFAYLAISMLIFLILFSQLIQIWRGKIKPAGHQPLENQNNISMRVSVFDILKETWLFGILGVLYLAWNQGHIIIAKYFIGDSEAGIYNSAMTIITTVSLLPSVAYSNFLLPRIHRWAYKDMIILKKVYNIGNRLLFGFGILAMISLIILSSWLVPIIFGDKYNDARGILIVLSLTLPIRFLGYNSGSLLMTNRFQKVKAEALFAAVLINLTLAYFLIPIWGLIGLASTIVFSEFVLVSFYFYYVKKYYFKNDHVNAA